MAMRCVRIAVMVISGFVLAASVANAQALDTNLEITEFEMAPSTTQAGANPNVSLFSRFCGPGLAITDVQPAPTAGHFRITTATPHGVQPFNIVKIRGVRTVADVNGLWTATQVSGDVDTFEVVNRIRPPSGDDAFAPGAHAQIAARTNPYGCVGDQPGGKLADFRLKLPPGFLANATALEACPTHLFIAASCSDRSIVGHSVSENIVDGGSEATPPFPVPTPVHNVQTLGLEPARFGGTQFPSEPSGPFPVTVRIRSTGDYGVDTAVIDIPRNLAGPQAVISQIETVLCAEVPCKATDQLDAATVQPLAPTRPFFRNPTSCNPATGQLEARSWAANAATRVATDTFIPTGCEAVPFDPVVSVTPTETNQAGVAGGQRVSIEYPEYEDDPIWQSALRDADITLPEGMTVAPEAGLGLHRCSAEQFGVDSATGAQLNDDPHTCPDASQIGSLEVTTPVLDFPLGGKAFLGPASGPGRPTPASPWRLLLLIEGAGQRIKLTGEMTISEQGQVRLALADMPQLPFTRLDLVTLGGEDAILENPPTCAPHQGAATLTGWSGAQKASIPSVTPTGCTLSGLQQDGVAAHGGVGHSEQAEGGPLTPLGGPQALSSSASVEAHAEGDRVVVNGDEGINEITVSLAGGTFTISDLAGVTAGPGCAQAGADVTCPAAEITSTVINGLGGGDTLTGSSIADRIDGGPGPDDIDGREGDDTINSGRGGIDLDLCVDTPPFRCADSIFGGLGFDLITYADRTGPIQTDLRPGRGFTRDDDGTFDGINGTEAIVGGRAGDELIGGISADHLNGGPGNAPDTICGGLGNDTVDYADKSGPVTVTIDGTLPTDPDIIATNPTTSTGARQDCRPTIKSTGIDNGQPDPNDPRRDCTANDGVVGENDCVGEDVENIVGSPFDDILAGNDPDALYGLGPRVEPAGANHLKGGGGDDRLDGGLGPDIFEGGSGADTVTYEGRTEGVRASIDGAGRDGNGQDFNVRSQRGDEIGLDIERLVGGNGDDLLRGDANANVLRGGPGNDFANGGEGDDGLFGDSGHDRLEGGAGDDLVSGGEGDDSLEGWKGNDQVQGDAGSDTADYRGAKVGVTVDLSRGGAQLTGGAGSDALASIENLLGSPGDDRLAGGPGPNFISCGAGIDAATADESDTVAPDCEQVDLGNDPPDCSQVRAVPARLWPANNKLRLVTLTGATDPDGDPVALAITGVTQDERPNGADAQRTLAGNQVLLRAERNGKGNGRVYRISFAGSDGKRGTCEGTAKVGVPHDQGRGRTAIDSGQTFNSFGP